MSCIGEGAQYIEIGKKGELGYGKIDIAADEHIVMSIWTGEPLYGGRSGQIKINKSKFGYTCGYAGKPSIGAPKSRK